MKKLLFVLVAVFSASIVAQDEMKHEPVANKAEYYIILGALMTEKIWMI